MPNTGLTMPFEGGHYYAISYGDCLILFLQCMFTSGISWKRTVLVHQSNYTTTITRTHDVTGARNDQKQFNHFNQYHSLTFLYKKPILQIDGINPPLCRYRRSLPSIPSVQPQTHIRRLASKASCDHASLCTTQESNTLSTYNAAYKANIASPAKPTTPTTFANAVGSAAAPVYGFGVALVATAAAELDTWLAYTLELASAALVVLVWTSGALV